MDSIVYRELPRLQAITINIRDNGCVVDVFRGPRGNAVICESMVFEADAEVAFRVAEVVKQILKEQSAALREPKDEPES